MQAVEERVARLEALVFGGTPPPDASGSVPGMDRLQHLTATLASKLPRPTQDALERVECVLGPAMPPTAVRPAREAVEAALRACRSSVEAVAASLAKIQTLQEALDSEAVQAVPKLSQTLAAREAHLASLKADVAQVQASVEEVLRGYEGTVAALSSKFLRYGEVLKKFEE